MYIQIINHRYVWNMVAGYDRRKKSRTTSYFLRHLIPVIRSILKPFGFRLVFGTLTAGINFLVVGRGVVAVFVGPHHVTVRCAVGRGLDHVVDAIRDGLIIEFPDYLFLKGESDEKTDMATD